jgi:hypothetical protein
MHYFKGIPAMILAGVMSVAMASAALMSGEQMAGTLTQPVDSASATVGQQVVLSRVTSEDGTISGAHMYGTVTSVTKAGQGRAARLQMNFTRLTLANGTTYAINGVVTGSKVNTKSNAKKEILGALGGMIVGNMIGKAIFHMSGAGFLGAAGGFLLAKNNRENVTIPKDSVVRVTLKSVRRQAGQ